MNSIERLKKAIEYIKSKNGNLTNDGISKSLRYRSSSYVSDLLGGSKPINDIFLSKLQDEYSINAQWIKEGIGEMFPQGIPDLVATGDVKNYSSKNNEDENVLKEDSSEYKTAGKNWFDEYIKEKEARRQDAEKTNATLTEIINTNLNAIQQLLLTIHRHDSAYHETILRSLARLEKKKNSRALIVEADTVEAAKMLEQQKMGMKVG